MSKGYFIILIIIILAMLITAINHINMFSIHGWNADHKKPRPLRKTTVTMSLYW